MRYLLGVLALFALILSFSTVAPAQADVPAPECYYENEGAFDYCEEAGFSGGTPMCNYACTAGPIHWVPCAGDPDNCPQVAE